MKGNNGTNAILVDPTLHGVSVVENIKPLDRNQQIALCKVKWLLGCRTYTDNEMKVLRPWLKGISNSPIGREKLYKHLILVP